MPYSYNPFLVGGLDKTVTSFASSVSNSDSTLTISPTTGAVVASLNLANANTWTATQTFVPASDAGIASIVRGYSYTQSANIQEWRDYLDQVNVAISPFGQLTLGPIQNAGVSVLRLRVAATKAPSVSFKQLTSNVVTLTTSTAHNFFVGESVLVSIGDGIFNGTYTITAIPSTTTFQYAKVNANVALQAASGTATVSATGSAFEVQNSSGSSTLMSLGPTGQFSIRNGATSWVQIGRAGNPFFEFLDTAPRLRLYFGADMGFAISGTATTSVGLDPIASGVLRLTNASTGAGTLRIGSTTTTFTQLNADGSAVFNENGADADFRVEGDTDANLIFLDASADSVGIGTTTMSYKFNVNGVVNSFGSAAGVFARGTAGIGGGSRWASYGTTDDEYIGVYNTGATLRIATGGMSSEGAATFNDLGADVDFRIEGDTNANLFFADASADAIGIGHSAPSALLHLIKTTEQLRVGYDTSNYYTTTVGSTGAVSFDAVGSGAAFAFSDNVTVNATVLNTELLTNGSFTGSASSWTLNTGWAYNSNNVQHSSNGTGVLTPNPAFVPTVGETYQLQVTFSTMTGVTGTCVIGCGGVTIATIFASASTVTYTYYFTATSTANLTFTPSNTSRFTIDDVSIKLVSGALTLKNPTEATAFGQPLSLPLVFEGRGWKTNATAASQSVRWREFILPVSGGANPTARLTWQYSINNGAWTTALFMASDSGMNFPGLTASRPLKLNSSQTVVASQINLGSASDITGVLQVQNGGTGQSSFGDGAIPYYDLTNAPAVLSYDVEDFYRYHIRERYGIGIGQTDNSLLDAKVTVRPGYECTGTPDACDTFVEMAGCEEQGCTWNESGTCSSYGDEETCNADPMCAWDAGTSCGEFTEQGPCEAQSPCVWNDYECSAFDGTDEATCTTGHPGCTWDTSPCSEFNSNQIGCEGQAGCTWDTANCENYNGTNEGECEGHDGCTWSDDISCSTYNSTDQTTCESGHAGCTWESADCAGFNGNEASCTAATGCTWDTANCDGFNDNYGGCTGAPEAACTWSGGGYDCSLSDGTDQGTCEGNAGCTWNAGLNECQGTCSGTYEPGTCSGTYFTGNCNGTWNPQTCTGTYAPGTCSGEYALNTCSGTWGTPDCTGTYGTGCDEAPFCDGTPSDCDTALTEGNCGLLDGCAWTEEITEHWLGDGLIDGDLEVVGQTTSGSFKWTGGTSGRVLYMTTLGVFTDSGNMTFDGTKLTVGSIQVTGESYLDNHVYIADGKYLVGGSSSGLGILSASSQKLSFWNKTPRIVQPTTSSGSATFTANSGTTVNDASTFDGYTLKQVVKALRDMGLLA